MFRCLMCGERLINWDVLTKVDFEAESVCRRCKLWYEIRIVNGVEVVNKLKGSLSRYRLVMGNAEDD